jgi:hypothetical protein
MNLVAIRDAIVARVVTDYVAAFPDVPLITENSPFDYNNPPDTFVELEVEFDTGAQMGMGINPKTRYRGCVYVTVTTREGKGSRLMLTILDWMGAQLGYYQTLRLFLQAPEPRSSNAPPGWNSRAMKVEFYANPT